MCDLTTKRTLSASMRASASCFISASVMGVASWRPSLLGASMGGPGGGLGFGPDLESVATVLWGKPAGWPTLPGAWATLGASAGLGASTTLPALETVMGSTRCGPRLWRPDLAAGRGAMTGAPGVAMGGGGWTSGAVAMAGGGAGRV